MSYPLASSTWGEEEIEAATAVLRSGRCTQGEITKQYEDEFAKTFGAKYAVACNSGSTANLLAVSSQLYVSDNPLRPGDEVLVPAVAWSTTYFPLHQYGLKIRLVDVDPETLNMDLSKAADYWACNKEKVKAVVGVNLLGNPLDWRYVRDVLWDCQTGPLILEDSCESMGAKLKMEAGPPIMHYAGTFGKVGTFSSFFSHHICTIEGGVAVTDDDETTDIMRCLRAHGWTRDLPKGSKLIQSSSDPWQDRYRFVLPGYNVRTDDLRSAIGLVQLKRLPTILEGRRKNAEIFKRCVADLNWKQDNVVSMQKETGRSSWYGFALVLQGRLKGKRKELVGKLGENGIETRPVMTGNFARHHVYEKLLCMGNVHYPHLPNADYLHDNGFFLGNAATDLGGEIERAFALIKEFVDAN